MNKYSILKLLFTSILLFRISLGYAQQNRKLPNNVIILVDQSGSVQGARKQAEAKSLLRDVIGATFNAHKYANWKWTINNDTTLKDIVSGTGKQSLIKDSSYLMLYRFGSLESTRDIIKNIKWIRVRNPRADLEAIMDEYPRIFADNWTFLQLARAKAAACAKGDGVDKYLLFEVGDELFDVPDKIRNNQNPYTKAENEEISNYDTDSTKRLKIAEIVYKPDQQAGKVPLKIIVSIVETKAANLQPPPPSQIPEQIKKITLLTPRGTKGRPQEASNVAWSCTGCPKNTEYTVIISSIEGKKSRVRQKTKATNFTIPEGALEGGAYRVRVQAKGAKTSKPTYMQYKGSSGGGAAFLIFLLLVGLGIGGYVLWKRQQASKTDDDDDDDD